MTQTNLNQTVGTASATIVNPQVSPTPYPFDADPDVAMWQVGGRTYIEVSQRSVPGIPDVIQFITISFADVIADDSSKTFDFSTTQEAALYYTQIDHGLAKPYTASQGEMTVRLDAQERMLIEDLNVQAVWNNERVSIEKGEVELTGFIRDAFYKPNSPAARGTGTMSGEMFGGPSPGKFEATEVQFNRVEDDPNTGRKGYRAAVGRWRSGFPPVSSVLYFSVPNSESGSFFDFAVNKGVRGSYTRLVDTVYGLAEQGTLNFNTSPDKTNVKGDASCTLSGNYHAPYNLKVDFDVTEPLSK